VNIGQGQDAPLYGGRLHLPQVREVADVQDALRRAAAELKTECLCRQEQTAAAAAAAAATPATAAAAAAAARPGGAGAPAAAAAAAAASSWTPPPPAGIRVKPPPLGVRPLVQQTVYAAVAAASSWTPLPRAAGPPVKQPPGRQRTPPVQQQGTMDIAAATARQLAANLEALAAAARPGGAGAPAAAAAAATASSWTPPPPAGIRVKSPPPGVRPPVQQTVHAAGAAAAARPGGAGASAASDPAAAAQGRLGGGSYDAPSDEYKVKWVYPKTGFQDNGGLLTDLYLGHAGCEKRCPAQIFAGGDPADGWNLAWMLPPVVASFERLLVHDLFWEQLVVNVMAAMGGSLAAARDRVRPFPSFQAIVADLWRNGFASWVITGGQAQKLGAWAMDLCWTELRVATGTVRPNVAYDAVGNSLYKSLAIREAGGTVTDLEAQTYKCFDGSVSRQDKIGNVFETYATLLLLRGDWVGMATMLYLLASVDEGGLADKIPRSGGEDGAAAPPGAGTAPPGAAGSSQDTPLCPQLHAAEPPCAAPPGAAPPGAAPPGAAPPGAAGSSQDTPLCPQLQAAAPRAEAEVTPCPLHRYGVDAQESCMGCKNWCDEMDRRAAAALALASATPMAAAPAPSAPPGAALPGAAPPGAAPPGAAPPGAAPPGTAPLNMLAFSTAQADQLVGMLLPMTACDQLQVVQWFAMSNEWATVLDLVRRFGGTICAEQAGLLSMAAVMAWRCSPLEICVSVLGCCLLFVVQFQHLASISPLPRH
jgi:hypothetical protein